EEGPAPKAREGETRSKPRAACATGDENYRPAAPAPAPPGLRSGGRGLSYRGGGKDFGRTENVLPLDGGGRREARGGVKAATNTAKRFGGCLPLRGDAPRPARRAAPSLPSGRETRSPR